MHTEIDIRADVACLTLEGEIDHAVRGQIETAIATVVAAGRPQVVVDMSGLTFIDSTGIGALARGYRHATEQGARFSVTGACGIVLRVLEVSGLHRLLIDGAVAPADGAATG